jgi:hypothetical protein
LPPPAPPPKSKNRVVASCSLSHADSCLGVGRIVGVSASIAYEIEAGDAFAFGGVIHLSLVAVAVLGEDELGDGRVVVVQYPYAGGRLALF